MCPYLPTERLPFPITLASDYAQSQYDPEEVPFPQRTISMPVRSLLPVIAMTPEPLR